MISLNKGDILYVTNSLESKDASCFFVILRKINSFILIRQLKHQYYDIGNHYRIISPLVNCYENSIILRKKIFHTSTDEPYVNLKNSFFLRRCTQLTYNFNWIDYE